MDLNKKRDPDIAIIQPPGWASQNPPLGPALLKSYLAERGFEAKNFDLNILLYNLRSGIYSEAWELSNGYYTWGNVSYVKKMFDLYANEILSFIYTVLSFRPKVIGMSVHWSSLIAAKILAQKFKEYSPGTKIVFGGPQVAYYTREWKDILNGSGVDAIVFGEGEESIKDYLEFLSVPDAGPIKGVAYLGCDRRIVDGGVRELIKSLDSLPFPDFSDFDLNLYVGRNVVPTYFSRGCINRCCYCTENKFFPYFRNRSGKRLFEEVVYQLSKYPKTRYFRMHDSISNGNMRELESFCDLLIKNKVKIRFNLENAVIRKEMNDRLYKKLIVAGCTLIGYGLETPSKRLLEYVGKAACLDADFEKVVSDGAKNGLIIGINMMFGLPGEKEEDFDAQLEFVKKVKGYKRRIIINPALNFCYFPEGCEAYADPNKFNVDMSYGELYWESRDGSNTFMGRITKFEKFCALADRLGYENLFGVMENANKNALLGHYYLVRKEYNKALDHLLRSFKCEIRTTELAENIIKLYGLASRDEDEALGSVKSYITAEQRCAPGLLDVIRDKPKLDDFMLNYSISGSMGRLDRFIGSGRAASSAVYGKGLKACIKRIVFKLAGPGINESGKKHIMQAQMLKYIDNKKEALAHCTKNGVVPKDGHL